MIIDKKDIARRRGIAGIIATVLLFAMVFSVGTSYFLFVNSNNLLYSQAASNRNSAVQKALSENAVISTSTSGSVIQFTVQNTGGISLNISSIFVLASTGALTFCQHGSASPCPSLPFVVSVGATSSQVSTGVTYTSPTTYTIKLVTQRGDVFTATYPPTSTTLAAKAISSGAIGDLYLNFHSYKYYDLTTTGCPAAGTQLGTTGNYSSGECFTSTTGSSAFVIPSSDSNKIGFSVQVTNLNNQSYDIVLDQFSLLYQVLQGPNAKGTYYAWYIASVATYNGQDVVRQKFSPYVLTYNDPTTVYFVGAQCTTAYSGPTSGACVTMSTSNVQASACNQLGNSCTSGGGYVSTVFIISHGWELLPPVNVATLTYATSNYGQNSPYVSSLYN
jgi:flagellin-like protein